MNKRRADIGTTRDDVDDTLRHARVDQRVVDEVA